MPMVGFKPTSPLLAAGERMDPSVSEPTATAQKLAAADDPDPELDPDGLRCRSYALPVCPPTPLQPLEDWLQRKLAHSLKFALPKTTTPAARSRATRSASCACVERAKACDPAVVGSGSFVSMLSLSTMGMPCKGPRRCPAARSASSAAAADSASGFSARIECRPSAPRSNRSMRAR